MARLSIEFSLVTAVILVVLAVLPVPTVGGIGGAIPISYPCAMVGDVSTVAVATPSPYSTGMAASVVLGAPNFTTSYSSHPNRSTFDGDPMYATTDPQGNVWAADYYGNRVVEFPSPFSSGENASVVIGQSNFEGNASGTTAVNLTNPASVAFDSQGDLWVADLANNRVLEFLPPLHTGEAASLVLGQALFSTHTASAGATGLDQPLALSFDPQGNLWVGDSGNNRVLEYSPPFSTDMPASLVIGQSSFSGNVAGLTGVNLTHPDGASVGDGCLWVADYGNNRVLGFPAPFVTGESALVVLGQLNFTSNNPSVGPSGLNGPTSVSVDPSGNVWVSDYANNRVLEYPRLHDLYGTEAELVLGQSSLAGDHPGLTATNLSGPFGAVLTPKGLWVTDAVNDRILDYIPTTYAVTITETGLPTGTPWTVEIDNQSISGNGSLSLDRENGSYQLYVPPVTGYLADPSFTPVVVNGTAVGIAVHFTPTAPNPFSNGMPASVVLGQPNFWSGAASVMSANSSDLGDYSYSIAFDSHGDLWVADWGFNRVLEYVPPFTNGMAATVVLGQSSPSGSGPGIGAANLSEPDGLAFDTQGNLWVADFGVNRIVEFPAPFTTGEGEVKVIGQSGFSGTHAGSGTTNLSGPAGIAFENGILWVTDYDNNRTLGFPGPQTTGEAATVVLGQSAMAGYKGGTTAVNESYPDAVAFDARGDMWVADYGNNRAIEYLAPLSSGEAASVVLGQSTFTTNASVGPASLYEVNGVAIDDHGNVWVADSGDNRVVEFTGPTFTNFQTPGRVLGQGNTSTNLTGGGPSGLDYPALAVPDAHGNIWVDDQGNDRVLGYVPAEYSVAFSASGISRPASWNLTLNGSTEVVKGSSVSFLMENGTTPWSVSAPGWKIQPGAGSLTVNGASVQVVLTFTGPYFNVTFTETGLAVGTSWSVTVAGVTQQASGSTILFTEVNGSYDYSVGNVSGFAPVVGGLLKVNGSAVSIRVTYSPTSAPSSSPILLWWVLIAIVVIAAVIALLLLRRRKKGSATPEASVAPPSGATRAPNPPASGPPSSSPGGPPSSP